MTDYTELKRLAEGATPGPWSVCGEVGSTQGFEIVQDIWNEHGTHTGMDVVVYEWSYESDPLGVIRRPDADFIAAANPAAVLALIADLDEARNGMKHSCAIRLKKRIELLETQRDQLIADNERLHESDQEATELCDTLSVLLGEIAVAVRGPEEPKSRHGFHDLPSRVKTVVAERDQLRAAISTPESVFINMKSGRIARISLRSAIDLHGEVINGDDAQQIEIARLRAEVAGLRTGYEAYERVNAELKAENEALRKRIDDMSPFKGAPFTGPDLKCLACGGYHYGLSGLPCPKFRNTAQSDLPETRSGQIGGPMGQGEQS